MRHVVSAADRARQRDEWRFRNLLERPELLARLRGMLENDVAGVRDFAKQELAAYNAWLQERGLLHLGDSEE